MPTAWSRFEPVRRRGAAKVEFLRRGYPRLSAGALQILVPKGRMFMNKKQNGIAKVPKATNIGPKGYQKRPAWNQKVAKTNKSCWMSLRRWRLPRMRSRMLHCQILGRYWLDLLLHDWCGEQGSSKNNPSTGGICNPYSVPVHASQLLPR